MTLDFVISYEAAKSQKFKEDTLKLVASSIADYIAKNRANPPKLVAAIAGNWFVTAHTEHPGDAKSAFGTPLSRVCVDDLVHDENGYLSITEVILELQADFGGNDFFAIPLSSKRDGELRKLGVVEESGDGWYRVRCGTGFSLTAINPVYTR